MLHCMKVLLNHLGGAGKVGKDKKGGGGGGSPGKVKKNVSFKKDPKYYDTNTKMLRFLMAHPKEQQSVSSISGWKQVRRSMRLPSLERVVARGVGKRGGGEKESKTQGA